MKKLCLLLALIMIIVAAFAGCGDDKEKTNGKDEKNESVSANVDNENEDEDENFDADSIDESYFVGEWNGEADYSEILTEMIIEQQPELEGYLNFKDIIINLTFDFDDDGTVKMKYVGDFDDYEKTDAYKNALIKAYEKYAEKELDLTESEFDEYMDALLEYVNDDSSDYDFGDYDFDDEDSEDENYIIYDYKFDGSCIILSDSLGNEFECAVSISGSKKFTMAITDGEVGYEIECKKVSN